MAQLPTASQVVIALHSLPFLLGLVLYHQFIEHCVCHNHFKQLNLVFHALCKASGQFLIIFLIF